MGSPIFYVYSCIVIGLFYKLKKLNILNILALLPLFYRLEKLEKSLIIRRFRLRFRICS